MIQIATLKIKRIRFDKVNNPQLYFICCQFKYVLSIVDRAIRIIFYRQVGTPLLYTDESLLPDEPLLPTSPNSTVVIVRII